MWTNAAGYQVPSPTGAAATEHAIVAPGPTDYYTLRLAGESGLNALQTQTIEITAQAGIPFWIDSEYMGHGGTGPFTGLTISGDPGASLACSFDNESGTATIRVKNNMPSMTITGLSIGDVHTISGNSYLAAVQIDQGETGVTISDSTLHDSDFGLLAGGNGNGTLTLTNDIIINNGSGITSSGAGLQHGMYLSWNGTSPDTDNAIISGGEDENVIGSVYEGGGTDAGSIAKIRYANATITNYTIASTTTCKAQSIAPTPCNASQENWPLQFPCGGYYTVGEADVGATKNGVVIERSPHAVKWALVSSGDEAASAGSPPNCPATNRASQTLTLANDIFIDDGPATDESGGNHSVAFYVPTTTGVTCSVANSVFVGPNWTGLTTGAHPAITSPCTDGGGNSFYPGRASAGLQPWPALPSPP